VELITLHEGLGSYRAVGALLGCDHKTVKRYVEAAGEAGQFAPVLERSRVTDDFAALICLGSSVVPVKRSLIAESRVLSRVVARLVPPPP